MARPPKKNTPPAGTDTPTIIIEGIADERLAAVAEHGCRDLVAAIRKHEAQILEDIERLKEEEGEKAKFKIGLAVTLNLGDNTIDTGTSYSVKLSEKNSHAVKPDDHPSLFGNEDPEE